MLKKILFFSFLVFLLLTSGCLVKKEPVSLETRVLTYWKIRSGGLDELLNSKNYDFYNDYLVNEKKIIISKKEFFKRFNIKLKNPKIKKVKYENKFKKAIVYYSTGVTVGKYFMDNIPLKNIWIFEEGRWKISLNKSKPLFFPNRHKIEIK